MGKFLPLQNQELVNLTPCDRLQEKTFLAMSPCPLSLWERGQGEGLCYMTAKPLTLSCTLRHDYWRRLPLSSCGWESRDQEALESCKNAKSYQGHSVFGNGVAQQL